MLPAVIQAGRLANVGQREFAGGATPIGNSRCRERGRQVKGRQTAERSSCSSSCFLAANFFPHGECRDWTSCDLCLVYALGHGLTPLDSLGKSVCCQLAIRDKGNLPSLFIRNPNARSGLRTLSRAACVGDGDEGGCRVTTGWLGASAIPCCNLGYMQCVVSRPRVWAATATVHLPSTLIRAFCKGEDIRPQHLGSLRAVAHESILSARDGIIAESQRPGIQQPSRRWHCTQRSSVLPLLVQST